MTPNDIKLQFQKVKGKAIEEVASIQRAVFLEMSKRIIDRTPVDTGRARAAWQADVESFANGVPEPTDIGEQGSSSRGSANGEKAFSTVLSATGRHRAGQDLTLSNNVEYIQYLDKGTSSQAPSGMTTDVINEFRSVVARVAG